MNQKKLKELIETFFTCNKSQLSAIFHELLTAVQMEEKEHPGGLMSRNYETAQANPEINTLPGNLKDARDAIFPYFWGSDGWSSKLHLENVKGPSNYASLIGVLACMLKNPNLCTDTYSQRSNELEVKAITALANLVFYHIDSPWGIFTMGGTISNVYGGKIGIEKVAPGAMKKGLGNFSLCGIVSDAAHYSNATLAGWLGLGTDNLFSIPTDKNISMRLDLFEEKLEQLYSEGYQVAFVIATFGTTDAFGIDNIEQTRNIIERVCSKYGRPTPQLHVDAAVGWFVTVLNEYHIKNNPFQLEDKTLNIIKTLQKYSKGLECADSVTIDFHKLGWGHYPASAFIVNRREELRNLFRNKDELPYFPEADARRDPALFTLETSRPAIGPFSVMATLNGLGLTGCQMLASHALEMARHLKEKLSALDYCKVLNMDTYGTNVVWWVLPKGRDASEIYNSIVAGNIEQEKYERYFSEIRRLFDKRQAMLDPSKDARLSYTTSIGYSPNGIHLPAWKAVFFNPLTDDEVIQRIVDSIEDLM